MKNLLLVAITLIVALAACGNKQKNDSGATASEQVQYIKFIEDYLTFDTAMMKERIESGVMMSGLEFDHDSLVAVAGKAANEANTLRDRCISLIRANKMRQLHDLIMQNQKVFTTSPNTTLEREFQLTDMVLDLAAKCFPNDSVKRNTDAVEMYSWLFFHARMLESMKGVGDTIVYVHPAHLQIARNLMQAYNNLHDYDKAIEVGEEAFYMCVQLYIANDESADIIRQLISTYEKAGRTDEAANLRKCFNGH